MQRLTAAGHPASKPFAIPCRYASLVLLSSCSRTCPPSQARPCCAKARCRWRAAWAPTNHLLLSAESGFQSGTTNHLFFEPAFFLQKGDWPLQVVGAFGFSIPLQNPRDNPRSKRTSPFSSLLGRSFVFRLDLLGKRR